MQAGNQFAAHSLGGGDCNADGTTTSRSTILSCSSVSSDHSGVSIVTPFQFGASAPLRTQQLRSRAARYGAQGGRGTVWVKPHATKADPRLPPPPSCALPSGPGMHMLFVSDIGDRGPHVASRRVTADTQASIIRVFCARSGFVCIRTLIPPALSSCARFALLYPQCDLTPDSLRLWNSSKGTAVEVVPPIQPAFQPPARMLQASRQHSTQSPRSPRLSSTASSQGTAATNFKADLAPASMSPTSAVSPLDAWARVEAPAKTCGHAVSSSAVETPRCGNDALPAAGPADVRSESQQHPSIPAANAAGCFSALSTDNLRGQGHSLAPPAIQHVSQPGPPSCRLPVPGGCSDGQTPAADVVGQATSGGSHADLLRNEIRHLAELLQQAVSTGSSERIASDVECIKKGIYVLMAEVGQKDPFYDVFS